MAKPAPLEEWSVCVVEGAAPDAVAHAIASTPGPPLSGFRVEANRLGTRVHAPDRTTVVGIPDVLIGPGFAGATSYAIERQKSQRGDVLRIWLMRDGDYIDFYTSNDRMGRGPPSCDRTWEIKGAHDIPGILAALDVPPALLGYR